MIKALLFDLDDTLLGNDLAVFIPAYFQQVARYFPDLDASALIGALTAGTRAMLANDDPTRMLRQVFLDHFPPARNGRAEAVWERFDAFYRSDFSALRPLTSARPAARAALEWAFAAGYTVVLATSPLFPLTAIRERMHWGGVDDLPFDLITHIENCHFAKPHPEYFAEILARLGLRPDEALMIGNDWDDDLVPAARLGLPHYWVTAAGHTRPAAQAADARPLGAGNLDDFLAWAQATLASLRPPPPPPDAMPHQLAGHLAYAMSELDGLPASLWLRRPAEGEWSLTEIICHLRDVDREVNLPRAEAVLATDNPFVSGVDSDRWAVERNYQAQSGPQALQDFAAVRQTWYRRLAALPPEAWARPARHALFGPTTLAEITSWSLDHDRIHLDQIRATLRKVRRD